METRPEQLSTPISGDILRGAEQIAIYLYGAATHRRKVYNLIDKKVLPHFRLGSTLCARKSVLEHWIEEQERQLTRSSEQK